MKILNNQERERRPFPWKGMHSWYVEQCECETKKDPVSLPGMEAFLCPVSCRQDSSLHDIPWVPKGRFKPLLIREGAAKKPPEARLKGPEKLIKIKRSPETLHTPYSCQQPHPWTIAIKPLITSSWVETHSFRGQELSVSPFAWQSNKAILFYFTQNSVSEIRFSTGVQRLSFQHHNEITELIQF